MSKYLLALDAGTGSIRAVLFSVDGEQVGVAQREWSTMRTLVGLAAWTLIGLLTGSLLWTASKRFWQRPLLILKKIAGISTTCMREGILLYDQDGNEIWACATLTLER